jgi:DNA gyrase subunit A
MSTRDEDFVTRLFVASTHTPVLFFTNQGQVYKEKVWRLPMAAPTARGKALVNILSMDAGTERVTTIMPLPEDEASWDTLDVMFATASGQVRRNKLSDFVQVNRAGKIAMKLDEGDHIVHVEICRADQNVLLTTAAGQCIRFAVEDVRVFKGRDSTGVRGISLGQDKSGKVIDRVISMTILNAFDASPEERAGYLKMRRAVIGESGEGEEAAGSEAEEGVTEASAVSLERYNEMGANEQFVLTLSERGFGKRTSSFEYRTSGRGGKGITAMRVNPRNGNLVASFPVQPSDQIMLVTDAGQLIRVPVDDIRIVGRASQGVTVFNTEKTERVVSVEHIEGEDESGDEVV